MAEATTGLDMLITRDHAIACATNVARHQGYAIGVHGSRVRDLDLLAAPWIEDCAVTRALGRALASCRPWLRPRSSGPRRRGDEFIGQVFNEMVYRDGLGGYGKPSGLRDYRDGAAPNIWLGTTIENRRFVHRADLLRETPAAIHFVSAEPLLGPLVPDEATADSLRAHGLPGLCTRWGDGYDGPELDLTSIDWLIAGGESGPKARPCREEWLRDLRDACHQTGTAYFLKQLGTRLARTRGLKGKGGGDQATLDGELHHAMPAAQGSLL